MGRPTALSAQLYALLPCMIIPHRACSVEHDDNALSLATGDGTQLTIEQRGLFQAAKSHPVPLLRLPISDFILCGACCRR